jgi:hypothetical protein
MKSALAYVYHFSAGIKNGVLHGERGTRGKPDGLNSVGISGPTHDNFARKRFYWAGEVHFPISGRWTDSCKIWQAIYL